MLGIFFTKKMSSNPNNNGNNNNNNYYIYSKSTKDMLLDSLLVALIVFIASLPANYIPTLHNLYGALRGFLYYFIAQLIIDRATANIYKQVKKQRGDKK